MGWDNQTNTRAEDFVARAFIEYINKRANDSGLRYDYAEVISDRKWRNATFDLMLNDILNSMDDILRAGGRNRSEEDIMLDAIEEYVDGHFAMMVTMNNSPLNQQDIRNLPDRTWSEMSNAGSRFERDWRQSNRRSSNPLRNGGGGRQQPQRRQNGGRIEFASVGGGGGYSNRQQNDRDIHNASTNAFIDMVDDSTQVGEPQEPSFTRSVHPEYVEHPPVVEKSRPVVDGPDYSKVRAHDAFTLEGERWELPSLNTLKLSPNEEGVAIPPLFDINTQILYYVQDDNNHVREELVKVNIDNRYIQQELRNQPDAEAVRPTTVNPLVAKGGQQTPVNTAVKKEHKLPLAEALTKLGAAVDEEFFIKKDHSYRLCTSLTEVKMKMRLKLSQLDTGQLSYTTLGAVVTYPVFIPKDDLDKAEVALQRIAEAGTLTDAHQRLKELSGALGEELYNFVNYRFSEYVRLSCRHQWMFKVKSFNFANAYELLLSALTERSDPQTASNFSKRMNTIIGTVMSRTEPGELQQLIQQMEDTDNATGVAFYDYIHMIGINKTADELGIGKQLETAPLGVGLGSSLSHDNQVTAAIREIYNSTDFDDATRCVMPIYLMTKDTKLFAIYPYMLRTNDFVLAEVVERLE